ncbi:hypothetical protein NQZ68_026351 [Dissostichus eleginoides]|nr:hypothetical protein NQZ68_026351 [Dissostichus eleginoides]
MSGERTTVKSSLMQKIRDRLRGKGEKADPDVGPGVGNKHASKDTRRVEIGWLNFEKGKYYQVCTRHGGGTRHMSVEKTVTMEELLDIGKALFFPNGKSAKGPLKDFKFDVRDFSHCPVPLENTVQQLYDQTKLRMLRIYTCSKEKDKEVSPKDATIMLSDTSSDFERTDHRPIKAAELFALRRACILSEGKSVTIYTDGRYAFGLEETSLAFSTLERPISGSACYTDCGKSEGEYHLGTRVPLQESTDTLRKGWLTIGLP